MEASTVDSVELPSVELSTGICVVETVIPVLVPVAIAVVGTITAVNELVAVDVTLLLGLSIVVGTAVAVVSSTGTVDVIASEEGIDVSDTIGVPESNGAVSIVVGTAGVVDSTTGTLDVTSSEEVDVSDTIGVSDARGAEVDSACRMLEEEVVAFGTGSEVADMVVDVVCAGLDAVLAVDEGIGKLVKESPVDDAGSDATADAVVNSEVEVLKEVDTGTDVEKPWLVAATLAFTL